MAERETEKGEGTSNRKIVNIDMRVFNWSTRARDEFNIALTPDRLSIGCLHMPDGSAVVIVPSTSDEDGEPKTSLVLYDFSDKREALKFMADTQTEWLSLYGDNEPVVQNVADYISNPGRPTFRNLGGEVIRGVKGQKRAVQYLSLVAEADTVTTGEIYAAAMSRPTSLRVKLIDTDEALDISWN